LEEASHQLLQEDGTTVILSADDINSLQESNNTPSRMAAADTTQTDITHDDGNQSSNL